MKRLKHRELRALARAVGHELSFVDEHATTITNLANDNRDDAIQSVPFDGGSRASSPLTQPERHADRAFPHDEKPPAGPDPIDAAMHRLLIALDESLRHARAARRAAGELMSGQGDKRDRAMASVVADAIHSAGAGYCTICDRFVVGDRDDRLVAGRCPPCYRYWSRHGRTEDRPRRLWDQDDEEGLDA